MKLASTYDSPTPDGIDGFVRLEQEIAEFIGENGKWGNSSDHLAGGIRKRWNRIPERLPLL